jgi:hypothetical protein
MVIGGFVLAFISSDADANKKHNEILHDVRSAGWHVRSSDIKAFDEEVTVLCAKFDLIKIGDKWVVAAKRPDYRGGGHTILNPAIVQPRLERACP